MSEKTYQKFKIKTEYFNVLREVSQEIDPYVTAFIKSRFDLAPGFKQKILEKYRFGKPQLRPALVRWGYELVGGQDWKKIIPACAAVEIKDTGYYCYDDVLDLRASPDLILIGGIFSSIAYEMINELFETDNCNAAIKASQEIFRLDEINVQAAFLDQYMRNTDEEYYLKKVEGYNFWEQALKIGGLLASGTDEQIEKIETIGLNIGKAYIIANDTWDFGKELEDFRSGKYTLPIIWALQNTTDDDKKILLKFIGKDKLSNQEMDSIKKIMVTCGAIKYGKQRAWELCQKALVLLQTFPDSKTRKMLEFSTTMTQRNKYFDNLKKYDIDSNKF
ncbi:polyprenyl synthetase family protein [Patescibacteria group bacterium]|nr:polyprenyl synthetase family protein [Patescibacteria group bacterium]MBU1684577.1 polyprenyl synthetase family protein [Patescibacteria group bacterium]MBU1778478.1 polyprenyl synthetase family protein [Patescibacteria group bacterium]MBU2416367.1 polyprenyl synthetase family protein [Patescibacteria group bacterium]